MLVLSFWPDLAGARIELLSHINVPEEDFAGVSQGWEKFYWTPWARSLRRDGNRLVRPMNPPAPTLRPATIDDVPLILDFIRQIAEYERLAHEVVADEQKRERRCHLTRAWPPRVLLAFWDDAPAGFAVFFPNYSTFLAQPGMYLEGLFWSELRPAELGTGSRCSAGLRADRP